MTPFPKAVENPGFGEAVKPTLKIKDVNGPAVAGHTGSCRMRGAGLHARPAPAAASDNGASWTLVQPPGWAVGSPAVGGWDTEGKEEDLWPGKALSGSVKWFH